MKGFRYCAIADNMFFISDEAVDNELLKCKIVYGKNAPLWSKKSCNWYNNNKEELHYKDIR